MNPISIGDRVMMITTSYTGTGHNAGMKRGVYKGLVKHSSRYTGPRKAHVLWDRNKKPSQVIFTMLRKEK
jgi:hypothetical protein